MSTLFWERFTQICEAQKKTPTRVARDIGISSGNPSAWRDGRVPNMKIVQKLSEYFGVEPTYFLEETINPPVQNEPREEDLRYAMFGGLEVSDEAWEKVKAFARFAAEEDRKRREGS